MLKKSIFSILFAVIFASSIFGESEFQLTERFSSSQSLFSTIQEDDFKLAVKAYDAGDYELAIFYYTRFLKTNPTVANAYYNRGLSYNYLKKYDLALEDFNKVIAISPDYANAYSSRGYAYIGQKQFQLAVREYSFAIKLNPIDNISYKNRGIAYQSLGETNLANADFAKSEEILAQKNNPTNPTPPPNNPTGVQSNTENDEDFKLGSKMLDEKNYVQAASYFTRYLAKYPNDKIGYVNRGLSFASSEKLEQAITDYTKALSIDSQYITAYIGRGYVNILQNKSDFALRDLNMAIKLDPNNELPYRFRAIVYKGLGENNLAAVDTAKAEELKTGKKPTSRPVGGTSLAELTPEEALKVGYKAYDAEKYDVAIPLFTKYLSKYPNNKEVYYYRGLANRRINNLDYAITDYNKSIELDPNVASVYVSRGYAFALQKKYDLAIRDYTTAIKLDPNEKQAYINRSVVYKETGKTKAFEEDDAKVAMLEKAEGDKKLTKLVPMTPNSKGITWTPVVEMDKQIFPAYFLARASIPIQEIKTETVIGDNHGILGLHIINPKKDSKIKIGVQLDPIIGYQEYETTLSTKDTRYRIFPKIIWDWEALKRYKKPTPANATFTLYINGELIEKRTEVVRIRSINEAVFSYRFLDNDNWGNTSELFAAYVNEDHEWIDQLLKEALDTRLVDAFLGYQGGPKEVQKQLFAIWFILQKRGFKYSSITDTSSTANMVNSQYVRLFEESIKVAQANCVDGSVLIAAILKKIGIRVGLVLVPGHCFLVFDMDGKGDLWGFETTVIGAIDFRDYEAKTVVDASYGSFKKALEAGDKRFRESLPAINAKKDPRFQLIDIDKARQSGINPISW
jgi:tetratricopeptide (TPR) repeat protein